MPISIRSVLAPSVAAACAAIVGIAAALLPTAGPMASPDFVLPKVQLVDIRLAAVVLPPPGPGRNLYDNVIEPSVENVVESITAAIEQVPLLGPPIADQIDINHDDLIQPLIGNTVYLLADIVSDPLNLFVWLGSYAVNQLHVAYDYVSSQLEFLGLPSLPSLPSPPPLAAGKTSQGSSLIGRNVVAPAAITPSPAAASMFSGGAARPAREASTSGVSISRGKAPRSAAAAARGAVRQAASKPARAVRSAR